MTEDFRQVLGGGDGAPLQCWDALRGRAYQRFVQISSGLFISSTFGHLCPWALQLYSSLENSQMTEVAHVADCYLLVIQAHSPPMWAVPARAGGGGRVLQVSLIKLIETVLGIPLHCLTSLPVSRSNVLSPDACGLLMSSGHSLLKDRSLPVPMLLIWKLWSDSC